ncbi:MAG TPA: hypothetical protein VK574_09590 [Terracidiphilus sp.]|nr:hypothetical protein [Terracidiphilus sp.]
MRQETYRFALDQATAELNDIVTQFESLKAKKEQIEKIVEALRPFIGLQAETLTVEASASFFAPEFAPAPVVEQTVSEEPIAFTFMQVSGPGMEVEKSEPVHVKAHVEEKEEILEPVHALDEATPEQVAYFRQPTADPFQRRIDDALWGWQQRPEGLLSPI